MRHSVHGPTLPKSATIAEGEVKARVRDLVLPHFEVVEEARGIHPIMGAVRLDFLCRPREEFASKGWPLRWFGIETKSEGLSDQRKRTAALLIRQARIYREAVYDVAGDEVIPRFVLISPPILTLLAGGAESDAFREGFALACEKIAAFDRVGILAFRPTHWSVYFHQEADPSFDSRNSHWFNDGQLFTKRITSRS